ncbi:hypothetical protein [Pseudorhodobacter sp.]|uniref:hypothetical protein n=1 Tax=Pseudorhodobacter sp. TaxID=1934400 RepID=UPI0026471CC1|nr:hypothetical protein [Pseudorhodobacter sp.]MDN5787166.1 hypothetical protein [Pseudorhodobacter sp.]
MKHTPFLGWEVVGTHDARAQAAVDAEHPEWTGLPATAMEARDVGLKHFFTGKPCKHGHVSIRWASTVVCRECNREYLASPKHRAWAREYDRKQYARPEDKKKFQIYMREYERRPESVERRREYNNRPEVKDRRRKYRRPDAAKKEREYFSRPEIKAKHSERNRRRDATKRNATPNWLMDNHIADMHAFYAEAQRLTDETGIPHHVDHIIPLTHPDVQGLHVPWNLQILTASENTSKNNSFDYTNENESWRTT